MRAEILCVGSELLLGQIIDTNAAYIARQLARAGIDVRGKQTVGDNLERITGCIQNALAQADVLIITGGLGPTTDDLTREAIARALGVELEYVPRLEEELRAYFASRNYKPADSLMRQAYLPAGTRDIPNARGTAPGVHFNQNGKQIFAVPGVPREMIGMLDEYIVPNLLEALEGERAVIVSRVLRAFGIGESGLADAVEDILTTAQNPTVAPLIYQNTEVHLRLTAKAPDEAACNALLDEMEIRVRERVGEWIFGVDDQTLPSIVVGLLKQRGQTVCVAESLTGGLVQSLFAEIPGASDVFRGGIVAYNTDIKRDVLGITEQTLSNETAVSEATVTEMARGARRICAADWAISTTGEAGPTSSSGAPVGTVWLGLNGPNVELAEKRELFGARDDVRKRAALWSIELLRRQLLS